MKKIIYFLCAGLLFFNVSHADESTVNDDIKAAEDQLLILVESGRLQEATREYGNLVDRLFAEKKLRRDQWYELQRLNGNVFMTASFLGHDCVVRELLKQGVVVDAKTYYGCTALHFAIQGRHPKVVKLLLDYGANMTVSNGYSETPLQQALGAKSVPKHLPVADEIVALLEMYGAETKKKDTK